jgi:hypothetical protein
MACCRSSWFVVVSVLGTHHLEIKGQVRIEVFLSGLKFVPVDDMGTEVLGFWVADRLRWLGDQEAQSFDGRDRFTRRPGNAAIKIVL